MRRILFTWALLGWVWAAAQSTTGSEEFVQQYLAKQKAMIGKPLPSFVAKSGDSTISNKSFEGKVLYVNFWFEACPPCVAEFEGLNELYRKLKDSAGIAFVALTFETPVKSKALQASYGLQYPVASMLAADCHRVNGGLGFPTSLVVDRAGTIRFVESGGSTNKKEAADHIMAVIYPAIVATRSQNP